MDAIKFSITRPVTAIVGVILVLLFGTIGLLKMPYQLSPTVIEPEITVSTTWVGATPFEIEREIIEEQEKVLKGIPALKEMESSSLNNVAQITLRFEIGTEVDSALLRVSNKLDEVPSYPDRVEKPVLNASGASTSPVIWMMLKTMEENPREIGEYRTFFENEIRQYLERVPGVSDLLVFGGTEREMHIVVDPLKMAAYGITVNDLSRAITAANTNISAGTLNLDRRNYRIRTIGEFSSEKEIQETIIRADGDRYVTLADVAEVKAGFDKPTEAMMHNGKNGIVVGVKPEPGVNVLELTNDAEVVVNRLNQEKLNPQGIFLDWAYDQRPYINGAIDLVKQNIFLGGGLAVLVLLLFLGSFSSTAIVAVAIPTSIIGTFMFMNAFGRNLNVVSLAGISFAVGMLVDNAIVVLENIDRHRSMGKSPFAAAYDGVREVWGAVITSTLTTVAVFLPVLFIQEEAGQLFKDIAIAVTSAITISLFVSVLVIPMLAKQFYSLSNRKQKVRKGLIVSLGSMLAGGVMWVFGKITASWKTRTATIVLFTGAAVLTAFLLFPKLEYLPTGNRNMIMNIMIPPPGLSFEERRDIGEQLFQKTAPHFGKDVGGVPGIKQIFYIGADSLMLFGTVGIHEQRGKEMIPYLTGVVNSFPGIFGVSIQAGIFENQLGGGRSIDVDVSGKDLNAITGTAGMLFGSISGRIPGAQIRPVPSLEMLYPEVRFLPQEELLKANGMNVAMLGEALDVFMDGRKIGDFKQEGEKKIDLVLMGPKEDLFTPETLHDALMVTGTGKIVPVSTLADIDRTFGLTEIRHLERERTVTLQVTPPTDVPLQEGMEILENDVIAPLEASGSLEGLTIRLSGAADKLVQTWSVLKWNFILAVIITYLLMSALFGNFLYPLIILFTVPMAAAGGFLGLAGVNLFTEQPLDVLTMLGFIILIGVVVNNAILIVHQSLNNIREGDMSPMDAVTEATRTRLRPVYMSAGTSICGMLPLVVFPGPGSELYRGLGSVVLGGLAVSTVFTVFLIPSLLLFFIPMEKRRERNT
ncbi:MAG: efflux RND transporter permease subunit [Desulfovibrionales bacterium]